MINRSNLIIESRFRFYISNEPNLENRHRMRNQIFHNTLTYRNRCLSGYTIPTAPHQNLCRFIYRHTKSRYEQGIFYKSIDNNPFQG